MMRGTEPVHVTIKVKDDVPRLRSGKRFRVIQRCIQRCHKEGFSVVEFSVQQNHIHLICEVDDEVSLARGMQGLKTRLARRLNRALGRKGTLFKERYHARALATPREVRNALCYCLNNARRHLWKAQQRLAAPDWVDGYSTAPGFSGYRGRRGSRRAIQVDQRPVVRSARTWLLSTGWKRAGPLEVAAVPGRDVRTPPM
jgi:REP element-mobilizing transposase RayT